MDIDTLIVVLALAASNLTLCFVLLIQTKKQDEVHIPKPSFSFLPTKEPKETEEERRYRILQENIENFDGTAKGQVKL